MQTYVTRRLLYMIPTILGITLACFALIQFVPGGPVEQMIANIRAASVARGADPAAAISPAEIENIKKNFGFDQPAYVRYFTWLGGAITGDLGQSYSYNRPVMGVILERMPISLFFGLTSFLLSYAVCIPLGMWKARKHHSLFDTMSSIVIFAGYVIPGYALGILLIIFFAGGTFLDLFPLRGVVSDNFEMLSFPAQVLDFLHHMVLPMICYMVGEFAFLTMLMKNSILEEIRKDYMRTAVLKGMLPKTALFRHALRNALIPIATRMSEIFTLVFAGALLIEKVFDIDGMGLLVWNSIVSRDYNVVMGIILISSLLTLFGRLFSDLLYTYIDPRIRLQ
ncbi:MAG: ABC transporter permease subunit [Leptospiraceae bacterium]|nr:ABC transporter permease subunit [Leptospiraceae bacterium]